MSFYQKDLCKAAIYLRLSREEDDKKESESIGNQRELCKDYLNNHKILKLIGEYVDDGYSGTNFERPGFIRMMEDVRKGKINVIVVKDLSRFGRNYIEVGRYLERTFPEIGVRFIAINDNYDSANDENDGSSLIIPIKNLINDAYCRDISVKIRTQLAVKMKKGLFVGGFATYGYLKDAENKHHLIVDEYAATIIRQIFTWKLEGDNPMRIAKKLNDMGVLPPYEYKQSQGLNFNGGFQPGPNEKWTYNTVLRILNDEIYTGTMVQGKTRKINYRIKRSMPVAKTEWKRVPDTHEAIITRELFDMVQEMMMRDTRTAPNRERLALLSGFLFCGDCKRSMIRRSAWKGDKCYYYYNCSTYKAGGDCASHNISEIKVYNAVLSTIQKQIEILTESSEIIKMVGDAPNQRQGVKTIDKQIAALEDEMARYKKLKLGLYEDFLDKVVSQEDYNEFNESFSQKLNAIEQQAEQLKVRRKKLLSHEIDMKPWLKQMLDYGNIKELDRKLLTNLIDRIEVYDHNAIEIKFRFEDEIRDICEYAAELKGEN